MPLFVFGLNLQSALPPHSRDVDEAGVLGEEGGEPLISWAFQARPKASGSAACASALDAATLPRQIRPYREIDPIIMTAPPSPDGRGTSFSPWPKIRLELPEVVDVVPREHLDDSLDRLLSALGVDAEVLPLFRLERPEKTQIRFAEGLEDA